jgi:hypothetical protein
VILKTLILILTAIPVLGIWALSSYILESDSNHTAFDLLILLWPLFFCVVIAGLIYIIKKPRLAIIPIGVNLVAICFYLFVDHFNIMVQYDKWIWRSMPGPFEESRMKESDTPRGAHDRLGEKMAAHLDGKITDEEYERVTAPIMQEIREYKALRREKIALTKKYEEGQIGKKEYKRETARIKAELKKFD